MCLFLSLSPHTHTVRVSRGSVGKPLPFPPLLPACSSSTLARWRLDDDDASSVRQGFPYRRALHNTRSWSTRLLGGLHVLGRPSCVRRGRGRRGRVDAAPRRSGRVRRGHGRAPPRGRLARRRRPSPTSVRSRASRRAPRRGSARRAPWPRISRRRGRAPVVASREPTRGAARRRRLRPRVSDRRAVPVAKVDDEGGLVAKPTPTARPTRRPRGRVVVRRARDARRVARRRAPTPP